MKTPRKVYRQKRSTTDSFKIKLGQTTHIYTIEEFRAMSHEAVDLMEAAGITHVKPGNLYVSPVDEKGNPIVRLRGQPLEDVTIPGPYRSAADEHGL